MKKLLVHFDTDAKQSVFDQITAYDAGVDHILSYGAVAVPDVRNLVYGAIFTRGGEALKNTTIFIGGSDVAKSEEVLKETTATFFGPCRVSVMLDPNGCNTTAAAAVRKIAVREEIRGKRAVVLAGTGPVGMRVAVLLALEGCQVVLTSRSEEKARLIAGRIMEQFDLTVHPVQVAGKAELDRVLTGVEIVVAAGGPGVNLLPAETWERHPTLETIADVNAVAPLGVEGIKATDDGVVRHGKVIYGYGALAIGNFKMKVHRKSVRRLFERNDLVLDTAAIYEIARALGGQE